MNKKKLHKHFFLNNYFIKYAAMLFLATICIFLSCNKKNEKKRETSLSFKKISDSGKLRILTTKTSEKKISDQISPKELERNLLKSFADRKKLKPEYIFVDVFNELFNALDDGKGDLIADNISITKKRKKFYDFTIPIYYTQDIIVASLSSNANSLKDMTAGKLYIEQGSSYFNIAESLIPKISALRIVAAPYSDTMDKILAKTANGQYDFAITDLNSFKNSKNLKIIYRFPKKNNIAWALPKHSSLTPVLNSFLQKNKNLVQKSNFVGDWKQIKKRGFIRILTRNNPVCYFIHRGAPMGFEYELISLFAKKNNIKVVAIVPPEWSDLFQWLKQGRGDIIAAGMSLTNKRKKENDIAFSNPYKYTKQLIVCRNIEKEHIKSINDLNERTIFVRTNSSYLEQLEELQMQGVKLKIQTLPENIETYEIIKKVADGIYDLTVADDVFFQTSTVSDRISAPIAISASEPYVWGIRKTNIDLLNKINKFIKIEFKNRDYNIFAKRYFKSHITKNKFENAVINKYNSTISKYDAIIKKYATQYDLPWCLITAQMFQESRFNPHAKSWSGAIGLLQIMKQTAEEMNCKNPENPEENIKAGIKYLKYLHSRLPETIKNQDRICFALAAYNGGYGHLSDARHLAVKLKYDENKWIGNVENAMKLLSQKKYYSNSKYGYCRADEIVSYVRNILIRYLEYSQIFEN